MNRTAWLLASPISQVDDGNDCWSDRDLTRGGDDWADRTSIYEKGRFRLDGDIGRLLEGNTVDTLPWSGCYSALEAYLQVESNNRDSSRGEHASVVGLRALGDIRIETDFITEERNVLQCSSASATQATRDYSGDIVALDSSVPSDDVHRLLSSRNIITSQQLATNSPKRLVHPSRQLTTSACTLGGYSYCHSCSRSFTLLKDLRRHHKSVHAGERFMCLIPGCKGGQHGYSRRDKLLRHLRTHHSQRLESAESPGYEKVASHKSGTAIRRPVDQIRGITSTCSYKDTIAKSCISDDAHLDQSSAKERRSFTCPLPRCNRIFTSSHDLKRHVQTARVHLIRDALGGYRCAALGCTKTEKIWMRLDNFRKHLKQQHGVNSVDMEQVVRRSTIAEQDYTTSPLFAPITTPGSYTQKSSTKPLQ